MVLQGEVDFPFAFGFGGMAATRLVSPCLPLPILGGSPLSGGWGFLFFPTIVMADVVYIDALRFTVGLIFF